MQKILILSFILSWACQPLKQGSDSSESNQRSVAPTSSQGTSSNFRQIERLARPGINEALLVSNDHLLAFNSIPPTLDLATDNPTVLAVLTAAAGALGLFDSLEGTRQFASGFDSNVVKGFLPDVMRIDTSASIPPGTYAYNGNAVALASPQAAAGGVILTGGRKLEDDVIDISLSYLVTGNPGSPTSPHGFTIVDNVSYEGVVGNTAQGHKKLHGQTNFRQAASYPFLATPY